MIDVKKIRQQSQQSNVAAAFVKSDVAVPALGTFEAFRGEHDKKNKVLTIAGGVLKHSSIDISWLEAAAESYKISADPDDYVLVDVPIVTVDIPNRNMQCFPFEEVSYFDPIHGRQIYKTFTGKPTHIDHENRDPLKAKGVHFDAAMEYVPAYGVWKIRVLTGWDRTKDPYLVDQIISGKRPGFSMGALVSAFVCSICGAVDTNVNPCDHMDPRRGSGKGAIWDVNANKRVTANDMRDLRVTDVSMVSADMVTAAERMRLVYQLCVDCNYIETSNVGDPADPTADISGSGSTAIWMQS